jgi:LPXTG-motif cell wall-anchored protein
MKGYKSDTIRNVALVGHGGCGKTTFLEAALLETGVIDRLGKVEDGNTVSDYDKMEIEKGFSINTSIVPIIWKDNKINFIDTPGYFDFVEEVKNPGDAPEAPETLDRLSYIDMLVSLEEKLIFLFDDPVDPSVPALLNDDFAVDFEITIPDEEVPLANVPKTGDISGLWAVLSGFSAAGMALLGRKRKEEE